MRLLLAAFLTLLPLADLCAQSMNPRLYDPGTPSFNDLWVDPSGGDDTADGTSRGAALATLSEAWNRIPIGEVLSVGYRIRILPGTLPPAALPNYMESRYGTATAPIQIEAADGPGTVTLHYGLNIFDCRYLYLVDLILGDPVDSGDVLHYEACDHIYVKDCVLVANRNIAQECLKINQTQYVYLEGNDISGAGDNAIDFVGVQYGHVVGNKVHNSEDWCMYAKGGSAYLRIEGNTFYNGGTGGFTAGQGTGYEFMTSPWLHYEAYNMVIINNLVYDVSGAAIGVQGGYNVLVAHNTAYRIGERSHVFEAVAGLRSCDGNPQQCGQYQADGGWGPAAVGEEVSIPNRNVYVYNNIFYNPAPYQSQWQQFAIFEPRSAPEAANVPNPIRFDTNLQFSGNIVWNGPVDHPLGIEGVDACPDNNETCNQTQLRANNAFNQLEPQFILAASGDFSPLADGNLYGYAAKAWPSFPSGDLPSRPAAPVGTLSISVTRDFNGNPRGATPLVGAFESSVACNDCTPTYTHTLYLPHYTFVNSAWSTELTLANPSDASQNARMTAYDNAGNQVGSREVTLLARSGLSERVEAWSPAPSAQAGWIKIETSDAAVQGLMKFTAVPQGGTSSLPLTSVGGTRLLLPLLEASESLISGMAFVNLSSQAATVSLRLDGTETAVHFEKTVVLNPGQKLLSVITDLFPGETIPSKSQLLVTSNVTLTGFALTFTPTRTQIIAVPATILE